MTLDEFCSALITHGLLSSEALERIRSLLGDVTSDRFARALVQNGKLTEYQAQEVIAGRGKRLVLGNYLVLSKLGQGGMGVVFKAVHLRMRREVAIKLLATKEARNPLYRQRFQKEIQAAAILHHPNIVTAFDADELEGVPYLVMQYIPGADLESVIKMQGPLSPVLAVDYIIQAARGMEYAHRNGIIHRDLKPSNLLLEASGTVKVMDLGLARIDRAGATRITVNQVFMGTADFMAPEQANDSRQADARSDIYSLGVTLWELLMARPMYGGEFLARLASHQRDPIPSLRGHRGDVPGYVDSTFQRMVAKKPEDRCQSMAEVIRLLSVASGSVVHTSGKVASSGPSRSPSLLSSEVMPSGSRFLGELAADTEVDAYASTKKVLKPETSLRSEQNYSQAGVAVDIPDLPLRGGRGYRRYLAIGLLVCCVPFVVFSFAYYGVMRDPGVLPAVNDSELLSADESEVVSELPSLAQVPNVNAVSPDSLVPSPPERLPEPHPLPVGSEELAPSMQSTSPAVPSAPSASLKPSVPHASVVIPNANPARKGSDTVLEYPGDFPNRIRRATLLLPRSRYETQDGLTQERRGSDILVSVSSRLVSPDAFVVISLGTEPSIVRLSVLGTRSGNSRSSYLSRVSLGLIEGALDAGDEVMLLAMHRPFEYQSVSLNGDSLRLILSPSVRQTLYDLRTGDLRLTGVELSLAGRKLDSDDEGEGSFLLSQDTKGVFKNCVLSAVPEQHGAALVFQLTFTPNLLDIDHKIKRLRTSLLQFDDGLSLKLRARPPMGDRGSLRKAIDGADGAAFAVYQDYVRSLANESSDASVKGAIIEDLDDVSSIWLDYKVLFDAVNFVSTQLGIRSDGVELKVVPAPFVDSAPAQDETGRRFILLCEPFRLRWNPSE